MNVKFESMSEAFDYCREGDSPVTVYVKGKRYKLFPSGRAKLLITPQEVMDAYRAELRRLYGDEIADKTTLHYSHGWYYLELARQFQDGSVGTFGPAEAKRKKDILRMTENLRKREPEGG